MTNDMKKTVVTMAVSTVLAATAAAAPHPHYGEGGHKHPLVSHEHNEGVLGVFDGILANTEKHGFSFAGEYIFEYTRVLDGGINQRGDHRNLFVFDAEMDLDTLFGFKNAVIFAQYQHGTRETGGTLDTGDIQAYSNLELEHSIDYLYELWFQQTYADGRFRVKIGKVDANTEFNYVEAAGGFANSSAGFSPTMFTFPTYPDPAMSVNLFAKLGEVNGVAWALSYGWYDGAAAVDGIETGGRGPSTFFSDNRSNDMFHIAQVEASWESFGGYHEGRASLAAWYHTGAFETFDGGTDFGTHGFTLTAEQRLTKVGDEGGLFAFFQYGWADEEVSEIKQHFGFGIVAQGAYVCRPEDSAGIYVSLADLAEHDAAGFPKDEIAIDAYYNYVINEHISVQPELQYIINPSGSASVSDALVAGVRASFAF